MKYINNGPKQGTKPNYIAIKGKRVYVGEEFEASPEDVAKLEDRFNIKPVGGSFSSIKSFKAEEKEEVAVFEETFSDDSEDDDFEFQTEEDAEASVSFFNTNDNILDDEKGVK